MNVLENLMAEIASGPTWVRIWVNFMVLMFLPAAVFAFYRRQARWLVLVMVLNVIFMLWLYAQVGYVRLLGLPHVVLWTPLVIAWWKTRAQWRVKETIIGKWILAVFVTMIISLVFDYADVTRYLLGERGAL